MEKTQYTKAYIIDIKDIFLIPSYQGILRFGFPLNEELYTCFSGHFSGKIANIKPAWSHGGKDSIYLIDYYNAMVDSPFKATLKELCEQKQSTMQDALVAEAKFVNYQVLNTPHVKIRGLFYDNYRKK